MLHFLLFFACTAATPDVKDSNGTVTENTDSQTTDTTETITSTSTSKVCDDANEDCDVGMNQCRGDGIDMLPGANCLNCHSRNGDREAPIFNAAGTVYSDKWGSSPESGATVRITDANGKTYEERTGRAGSFRFEDNIAFPANVEVETNAGVKTMNDEVKNGECNSCHACTGSKGEKIYAAQ